jgi:hypothetical protein
MRQLIILYFCLAFQLIWIVGLLRGRKRIIQKAVEFFNANQKQQTVAATLARRVDKAENELTAALNDAAYWEGLARKFEEEVLKIAAGEHQ